MISNVKVSDGAYLERRKIKLVTFPDGIARLITLKQRQWNALDWIGETEGDWAKEETICIAYQLALENDDPSMSFETKLRRSLPNAISGCMTSVIQNQQGLIQDDSALRRRD